MQTPSDPPALQDGGWSPKWSPETVRSIGCNPDPRPAQPPTKPQRHYLPIHRFTNVPGRYNATDVALDTASGQLCRTWTWEYRTEKNPNAGGLDTLPTCLSVFQNYPTDADENETSAASASADSHVIVRDEHSASALYRWPYRHIDRLVKNHLANRTRKLHNSMHGNPSGSAYSAVSEPPRRYPC
jgi:hypothetical protein